MVSSALLLAGLRGFATLLFSLAYLSCLLPLFALVLTLLPLFLAFLNVTHSGATKEAIESAPKTRGEAKLTAGKSSLRAELNKTRGAAAAAAESAKAPAKKNPPKAPAVPKKAEAKKASTAAASKKRKAEEEPTEAEAAVRPDRLFGALVLCALFLCCAFRLWLRTPLLL